MNAIHSDRLSRLRARMAETRTDLVALGPTSHMTWLADLNPHGDERPVMLMVSQDYAGVLMPSLNAASARSATDLPFHEWADAEGPDAALSELIAACGATGPGLRVDVDEAMRADFAVLLLDALDAPKRGFARDSVGYLRLHKDEGEVAALKASAVLNDDAVRLAWGALREGMTECDLRDVIHAHYRAQGATSEFTIIGFGGNGAYPHHHTGNTVLERDMAVLIDTGCRLNGYPSDMTRCGWFGTPNAEFLEVSRVVEGAVRAALAASRPGVRASAVDRAARDHIAAAGYGPNFLHRLGHGLGIDIHEPPYITATSETVLEEGQVFSIEPGVYLSGRFGVRHEDIVVLRADGPEILSDLPRDLRLFGRAPTWKSACP